jgi:methylglyoxal synthase
LKEIKNIALVAHDNRKKDLIEWIEWNYTSIIQHRLICTGTTGGLVEKTLKEKVEKADMDFNIIKLKSGPLGGDQQMGAMIAEGKVDVIIFLWDPIAVLYNVPTACNRATADFLISSSLIGQEYTPVTNNYESYTQRNVNIQ